MIRPVGNAAGSRTRSTRCANASRTLRWIDSTSNGIVPPDVGAVGDRVEQAGMKRGAERRHARVVVGTWSSERPAGLVEVGVEVSGLMGGQCLSDPIRMKWKVALR